MSQWDITYYGPTWKGPKSILYSVNIEADTATEAILKANRYLIIQPDISLKKLNRATSIEALKCP